MIVGSLFTSFAAACTGAKTKVIDGVEYCTNLTPTPASDANLQNLVHLVVGILAVIAVLIIVMSALNIVTAGGDSSKVAKARSAIIYSLVGLVIIASADIIVTIIIGRL